jgi:hypothetical protein
MPFAQAGDAGAGDDTAGSIVEVLPAPPATVRATIDLQELLELLRELDHWSRLLSLSAAVRFTMPHTRSLNLRDILQQLWARAKVPRAFPDLFSELHIYAAVLDVVTVPLLPGGV